MVKQFLYFWVVLLWLPGCASLSGGDRQSSMPEKQIITAEGRAEIQNGAVIEARMRAIQQAIRQAAKLAKGQATSRDLVANTKVVDEWRENGSYNVQIVAVTGQQQGCQPAYKKRIVATAFPIVTSGQISGNESQDLYGGIPREIVNQLMESGDFIGRNQTRTVIYSRPDQAPEIISAGQYQNNTILTLAQQNNSQFVLSGVIRDFEVESTEYVRGAGLFAQVKAALRDVAVRRGITIDVYVHDGLSGALLFQHRYSDSILGDVWIPVGYSVGSERFKATPAGEKISQIIQLASQDIHRVFSCYPFTTRVLKINGNQVVIAAGAQDKIKSGDRFVLYGDSRSFAGLSKSKRDKQAIGLLSIDSVTVRYATGHMEVPSNIRKVRVGDWVKSW
jgi:hypothetical protein